MPEADKMAPLQKVTKEAVQEASSHLDHCPHHFGYLGQRSKSEEIPSVCLTCLKLVDCMLFKSKTPEVPVSAVAPIKREPSALKAKHEIGLVKEVNASIGHTETKTAKEILKEAPKPEIKTEVQSRATSANQFKVQDLDMVHASWSKTVCIDRQSMSGWGKTDEVEIESVKGKRARCKVYPIDGSEKRVIQVPDKIQLILQIAKDELVTVRPATGSRKFKK